MFLSLLWNICLYKYVFCSRSTEKFFVDFFEDSSLSMICTLSHWMFLFPPQLCDTYPKHLFVPASASTPIILGSSKFRSRGRLPVLSYFHSKTQVSFCYRLVVYIHLLQTCSLYIGSLRILDGMYLILIQHVACFLSLSLGKGIENTQFVGWNHQIKPSQIIRNSFHQMLILF